MSSVPGSAVALEAGREMAGGGGGERGGGEWLGWQTGQGRDDGGRESQVSSERAEQGNCGSRI